jgi:hypothetical protein
MPIPIPIRALTITITITTIILTPMATTALPIPMARIVAQTKTQKLKQQLPSLQRQLPLEKQRNLKMLRIIHPQILKTQLNQMKTTLLNLRNNYLKHQMKQSNRRTRVTRALIIRRKVLIKVQKRHKTSRKVPQK